MSSSDDEWANQLADARKHERRVKLLRLLSGFAVLGLAGGLGYWLWPEDLEVDPAVQARFEPHMASYAGEFPSGGAGEPHVAGRLLPVEAYRAGPSDEELQAARSVGGPPALTHDAWRIHNLYNSLPDELVASAPSQVGTLARVSCSRVEAGVYVPGEGEEHRLVAEGDGTEVGTAYRRRCEISLVDLGARREIGRQSFVGGDPPETATFVYAAESDAAMSTDINNRFGSFPREQMLTFLTSLPRR